MTKLMPTDGVIIFEARIYELRIRIIFPYYMSYTYNIIYEGIISGMDENEIHRICVTCMF